MHAPYRCAVVCPVQAVARIAYRPRPSVHPLSRCRDGAGLHTGNGPSLSSWPLVLASVHKYPVPTHPRTLALLNHQRTHGPHRTVLAHAARRRRQLDAHWLARASWSATVSAGRRRTLSRGQVRHAPSSRFAGDLRGIGLPGLAQRTSRTVAPCLSLAASGAVVLRRRLRRGAEAISISI